MRGKRAVDRRGQRSGKLFILYRHNENSKNNIAQWVCRCDCGTELVVRSDLLEAQEKTCCGCGTKEKLSRARTKHGLYGTRIYRIWCGLKTRCNNPKARDRKYYQDSGTLS